MANNIYLGQSLTNTLRNTSIDLIKGKGVKENPIVKRFGQRKAKLVEAKKSQRTKLNVND